MASSAEALQLLADEGARVRRRAEFLQKSHPPRPYPMVRAAGVASSEAQRVHHDHGLRRLYALEDRRLGADETFLPTRTEDPCGKAAGAARRNNQLGRNCALDISAT